MKRFFKKTWDLITWIAVVWLFLYILYLAATDQWLRVAKCLFFTGVGIVSAIFEIPEVLCWRFKQIIKSKE